MEHGLWHPIGATAAGGGRFARTYEWQLLGGAAAAVSITGILAKVGTHAAGVAVKAGTGVEFHHSVSALRGAKNSAKKKDRMQPDGSCSRMKLTVSRTGRESWYKIELYAGINKGQGISEDFEIFSGQYHRRSDTLYANSGSIIKAPAKRQLMRRGLATARLHRSPAAPPSFSDSGSSSGSSSGSGSGSGSWSN